MMIMMMIIPILLTATRPASDSCLRPGVFRPFVERGPAGPTPRHGILHTGQESGRGGVADTGQLRAQSSHLFSLRIPPGIS